MTKFLCLAVTAAVVLGSASLATAQTPYRQHATTIQVPDRLNQSKTYEQILDMHTGNGSLAAN